MLYPSRASVAAVARTRGAKSAPHQRAAASAMKPAMRSADKARRAPVLATAREQRLRVERAAAQLCTLLAPEQNETAIDDRAEVFRLDRDHRAAIRQVDGTDRADPPVRKRT